MTRGAGGCECATRETNGARALRAAVAASGRIDSARPITPSVAATRPRRLVGATRANQLPVRIARGRVAGKCPDIRDIGDLVGIAVDNGAGLVAGDRDHLRNKANGELRAALARLCSDNLGLVDRNEACLDLAFLALALLDRRIKAVIDLARQQVL